MLLQDRTAVVYGAGGSVGGAIAAAFARQGATVHLAGRTRSSLQATSDRITAAGGAAHVDVVDALDEDQVDRHAAAVVETSGGIDISVNVISDQDLQGVPFVDMSVDDYVRPIAVAVRSKFLTARAAGRQMITQGSGVIMFFGGTFDWKVAGRFKVGGIGATFDAVEAMRRQLASELGPNGVRVVTLRSSGLPQTIPADFEGRDEILEWLEGQTVTGRTATLDDVGNVAVFAASDHARMITGAALNMTGCGVLD